MYIFSQDRSIMLNSDNVTAFSCVDMSSNMEDVPSVYGLIADGYEIGSFNTEKECFDRMDDIFNQIAAGAKVYDINRKINEK